MEHVRSTPSLSLLLVADGIFGRPFHILVHPQMSQSLFGSRSRTKHVLRKSMPNRERVDLCLAVGGVWWWQDTSLTTRVLHGLLPVAHLNDTATKRSIDPFRPVITLEACQQKTNAFSLTSMYPPNCSRSSASSFVLLAKILAAPKSVHLSWPWSSSEYLETSHPYTPRLGGGT